MVPVRDLLGATQYGLLTNLTNSQNHGLQTRTMRFSTRHHANLDSTPLLEAVQQEQFPCFASSVNINTMHIVDLVECVHSVSRCSS